MLTLKAGDKSEINAVHQRISAQATAQAWNTQGVSISITVRTVVSGKARIQNGSFGQADLMGRKVSLTITEIFISLRFLDIDRKFPIFW